MKSRKPRKSRRPQRTTTRSFQRLGVEVRIRESKTRVELTLDEQPIKVSFIDGQYHCQLANQFTAFGSVEAIVDTLLATEGRTWTLHGHLCDEQCAEAGHHHKHDHTHPPDGGHHHSAGGG